MNFNSDVLQEHLAQDLTSCDDELNLYRLRVLQRTLLKKFVPRERASTLDVEAKAKFKAINEIVSNYNLVENDSFFQRWRDQLHMDLMCDDYQSNTVTFGKCLALGRCGPGSSIGASGNDFYTKLFCSPVSSTSRFLELHFSNGVPELWKAALAANPFGFVRVLGSRISTVPKDANRNRTICVEPSLNMFYQLGAKDLLEAVLRKRYHIDISTQPDLNKELARLGSIDGHLATIDLKDASDMISYKLVKYLLPRETFRVLDELRSPWTEVNGEFVKLGMFSTMGNGFTFPLMTLLFASMLRVVYSDNGVNFSKDSFGVFGDDIICHTKVYENVVARIHAAGFVVNLDKSYNTGFFRESCGGDYYHGFNVRGVYIKEITNESDAYSVFNRLHYWSLRSNISLERTLSYVKGLAKFRPVPRHASVHEGHIFPRFLLSSPKSDKNGALFYWASDYRTKTRRVGDDTINPIGALVSALGGYIVDNRIPLRLVTKKCTVIRKRTPCWDYASNPDLFTNQDLVVSWQALLRTASSN